MKIDTAITKTKIYGRMRWEMKVRKRNIIAIKMERKDIKYYFKNKYARIVLFKMSVLEKKS